MKKIVFVSALLLLSGCAYRVQDGQYPSYGGYGNGYGYGYQQYQKPDQGVNEGANHLNMVTNPQLPATVYKDCDVGQWGMSASTTQNGNQFSGNASQTCSPTASRRNGVNVGTQPTQRPANQGVYQ